MISLEVNSCMYGDDTVSRDGYILGAGGFRRSGEEWGARINAK